MTLAVVSPVYRNAATLAELRDRLDAVLRDEEWALHLVVDACPEGSGAVADGLARADPRVRVTHLERNGGQHAALVAGLRAAGDADMWVVLDADLQDPPEAVPALLGELRRTASAGVFAGRRGVYTSRLRRASGGLHRRVLHALTGLPPDAGAFLALDARLRDAVLRAWDHQGAPSVVAAAGLSGLELTSLPVTRAERPVGVSAWTSRARVRQGLRTVTWALRARSGTSQPPRVNGPASAPMLPA